MSNVFRRFNQVIESNIEPSNKNDIWLNKGRFCIYYKGEWTPITLNLEDASNVLNFIENNIDFIIAEIEKRTQDYAKKTEVAEEYAKKIDVADGLRDKVDKVEGKGLSTYDFNDSRVEEIARAGNEPIRIRWEDLKDLRDNKELLEGRLYRITDYVTTTTQENTQSAGHRFDIIVLALDSYILAEEAWAIYNEEDSYFADHGANLSAWKIWYCLDNNRERFAWASPYAALKVYDDAGGMTYIYRRYKEADDGQFAWAYVNNADDLNFGSVANWDDINSSDVIYTDSDLPELGEDLLVNGDTYEIQAYNQEGKGVIYRMIDEWGNDCPYDFKNIQFKRYILEADNAFATDVAKGGEIEIVMKKLQEMSHKIHTNLWYYGEYVSDVYPDANSEARYVPFGDVDYNNEGPQVLCEIDENNYGWFYTFHNENEDASLLKPNVDENVRVYDNTIKDSCYAYFVEEGTGSYYPTKTNAQSLNNIVFVGNNCYSNSFGNNCYSNSFGNDCYSNSFGKSCNSNSFGNECYSNSFGNDCYSNSFGYNCHSNSFGKSCNSNSFGNYYHSNSFGNSCSSNSFGNDCFANSFGNGCFANSFGNGCFANSFGNGCYSNSFGNECGNNTFIDMEGAMHGLKYNRFDNGAYDIRVYVDVLSDEYEAVQYNHVCSGVSGNIEFYADETYGRTYTINSDGEVRSLILGDLA